MQWWWWTWQLTLHGNQFIFFLLCYWTRVTNIKKDDNNITRNFLVPSLACSEDWQYYLISAFIQQNNFQRQSTWMFCFFCDINRYFSVTLFWSFGNLFYEMVINLVWSKIRRLYFKRTQIGYWKRKMWSFTSTKCKTLKSRLNKYITIHLFTFNYD